MPEWTWDIIGVLVPAVVTLIGAAVYCGAAYLKRRADAIENSELRAYTKDFIGRAAAELDTAVRATGQTYVDTIKQSRKDGKLTDQEQAEARRRAFAKFRAQMGEAAMEELERLVGDLSEWMRAHLEASVGDLKKEEQTGSSRPSPAA